MNKSKKSISIKDVAKKAGVSISTVSRALNNSGYVSKKLKNEILIITKEFKYEPNVIARGLRIKKTNTIAVIMPDLKNPYYSEIVEAIEGVASNNGYDILIVCTFFNEKKEVHQMENLKKKFVDGFIIIHGYYNYNFLKNLTLDSKIPIVTIDRRIDSNLISSVYIDYIKAVKKEVDYLYKIGHKKIAYIGLDGKIKDPAVDDKIEGFFTGLKSNNIFINKNCLYTITSTELNQIDNSYKFIKNNYSKLNGTTAILAGSDYLAIGVIRALKELNIKIPEQVSVMGFDNINLAKYIEPTLTTLENPKKEKGIQAIKQLIKKIESPDDKIIQDTILASKIIARESTKKII